MKWDAKLFLDEEPAPVAIKILNDDYRPNGGMKPGSAWTTTFKIGFVRGDENWTTLQIRNAAKTRVEMKPVVSSVRDFSDELFVPRDFSAELRHPDKALEARSEVRR